MRQIQSKKSASFLRLSSFVEQASMNKIKGNKNTGKKADRDHLFQDILDRIC